ncbi:MAG: ATP-grasp domain-containing protein [Patescibacteria group bacterium]|jgi:D-alanine-D-alanine ligase
MNIVFLYNVRHHYPDPNDYRHQVETDFDDPKTTEWQISHLRNLGHKIIPIEADDKAYGKLYRLRKKIGLVFNVAEGMFGKDREAQFPAILEMLQIPYTGSSPLTSAIILNKVRTKEILKNYKVPVLDQCVFENNEVKDFDLKFPVIIKPISEGSSAGITRKSVVNNTTDLKKQVAYIIKSFNEPAMVEPFLSGREFSVAMVGNPPQILPIIEPNHNILPKKYLPFDSLEVKWFFEEERSDYLLCPAKISDKLKKRIEKICLLSWKALKVYDYCRIDIKCDEKENPFVLEVNSPPGIMPPEVSTTSYFPLAARKSGMDYESLLKKIINTALTRYKK